MATRAERNLEFAVIRSYTIASGQTVTIGKTVTLATDSTIQDAGAGSDLAIGIVAQSNNAFANATTFVIDPTVAPCTLTTPIEIILLNNVVVPMKVGTGGSTRAKPQKVVSDGVTDCASAGGGTNETESIGIAMQSGNVGDFIGVLLGKNTRVNA